MSEQINAVIDNLADKLGVAVSEIYKVMETQASVEIVKSAFNIALCLIVLVLCWVYVQKVFIETDENGETVIQRADDDCGLAILAHILLAIGVVIVVILAVCLTIGYSRTIIQCIMNPQYWALTKIFELLK